MLRGKANYDVKKVLELGFAATAKLKQTQQTPAINREQNSST